MKGPGKIIQIDVQEINTGGYYIVIALDEHGNIFKKLINAKIPISKENQWIPIDENTSNRYWS